MIPEDATIKMPGKLYLSSRHGDEFDGKVESLIEAKEIGDSIKRMRLKRSMGLVQLGLLCGLSSSYLSQLETGKVIPTLRNLARIAMAFKVDIAVFFRDTESNCFRVSRGQDRARLPIGEKGSPFMFSESMSSLIPNRSMVPCIAELLPKTDNEVFEPKIYQGLEFAIVLEGAVCISSGERSEICEKDDVIWIDSGVQRHYRCAGKTTSRVMIISFPTS